MKPDIAPLDVCMINSVKTNCDTGLNCSYADVPQLLSAFRRPCQLYRDIVRHVLLYKSSPEIGLRL